MLFADLPPQLHERVICAISAAMKYAVPANIVLAVAEKEAGKPGLWVKNSNGTHDVGAMQFNTRYLADLGRYGITAGDVAQAGCYPFDLAAWRLRQHLRKDSGDVWTRAANYHSRTPRYNAVYRHDLMRRAARWADWLEARFVTREVGQAAVTTGVGAPDQSASPRQFRGAGGWAQSGVACIAEPCSRAGAASAQRIPSKRMGPFSSEHRTP